MYLLVKADRILAYLYAGVAEPGQRRRLQEPIL